MTKGMIVPDWYDKGREELFFELWDLVEAKMEDVKTIYSHLCEIGLIDYDIEKEILHERYQDEDS